MIGRFTNPSLLSALAVRAPDGDGVLARGIHLRVLPDLQRMFPVGPWLVLPIGTRRRHRMGPRPVVRVLEAPAAGQGGFEVWLSPSAGAMPGADLTRQLLVGAEVFARGDQVSVQLRDQQDLLLAQWARAEASDMPLNVGWPVPHRLIVNGVTDLDVVQRDVSLDDAAGVLSRAREPDAPVQLLRLPVGQRHAWYAGGCDRSGGMQRARLGAPAFSSVADHPGAAPVALSPDDEERRVAALTASGDMPGLLDTLRELVDRGALPWAAPQAVEIPRVHALAPPPASVYLEQLGLEAVQAAAVDPGLARFVGLADVLDERVFGRGDFDAVLVVGAMVLNPAMEFKERAALGLEPPIEDPAWFDLYRAVLQRQGLADAAAWLGEMATPLAAQGLMIRPCMTAAWIVAPALPPVLQAPRVRQRVWLAPRDALGRSQDGFAAMLQFERPPHVGLIALARQDAASPDGWRACVDPVEVAPAGAAAVTHRAAPLLMGTPGAPESVVDGLLADEAVPAEGANYQVAAADLFGRFGPPTVFDVTPPPRPQPPAPALRWRLELNEPEASSTAELSPGLLVLRVHRGDVTADGPPPAGPDELHVPAADELPAGCRPIVQLELAFNGVEQQPMDVSAPGREERQLPLPALAPMARGVCTLAARYVCSDGSKSTYSHADIAYRDRRVPPPVRAGRGLYWSSRPGPGPEVEVRLRWRAEMDRPHRVLMGDERAIELLTNPGRSRAALAQAVADALAAGRRPDMPKFRPAVPGLVLAGVDGWARLSLRLPRSLDRPRLVGVVAVGEDGGEADASLSDVCVVAVPSDWAPVAPQLSGQVDPATGQAKLVIQADGFDEALLRIDEAGLFDAGGERAGAGARAPELRVRRWIGPAQGNGEAFDPVYAPVVASKALRHIPGGPPGRFEASWPDDAADNRLPAFVPVSFWAQVRMPAQRRISAGGQADEVIDDGRLQGADEDSRRDAPSRYSELSAALVLMHVPPDAPASLDAGALQAWRVLPDVAGRIRVAVSLVPPPRDARSAPWRLAAWVAPDAVGSGWRTPVRVNGVETRDWAVLEGDAPIELEIEVAPDQLAPEPRLEVALVDPIGRVGVRLEVPVLVP